jgi:C4-dicarboxylate-specific signal transduction histidine kinase
MILIFSSFLIFVIAVILFLFTRSQRRLARKLSLEVNERKKSEAELKILTNDLEIRVKERTVDLEQSNNKLITEIEAYKIAKISDNKFFQPLYRAV